MIQKKKIILERRNPVKRLLAILVLTLAAFMVFAQAKKGPIVDKVYFGVKTSEEIGMKDAASGTTDLFLWGVQGNVYNTLSAEDKAKLEVYSIPSGSWSLMLNPIPNKAPYTWTVGDKTYFNPLAIREVRFAMNFLIDRKYVVDEILGGSGTPALTAMTEGQPGTYKFNLVATKLGLTANGNEKKAIQDITSAIAKASELPELKGKLSKSGAFWTFNGEPVTIKFLIRVDDPNGRLKEGRYIADQIEKAGIKVERLELDRTKCIGLAYNGDPAKYEWHIYTEGWGAGATRAYWDISVAQMYSPWYGYMAGGSKEGFWNYENAEIDALSQKCLNGNFMDADDYWSSNLRAIEIGLTEACRIHVVNQNQYYVANKARFNSRMAYGLGDGLNDWSITTADVKPDPKTKEKILKVTEYSSKGSLFMSAWDPVGVDGMSDTYTLYIAKPCTNMATFEAPNSAIDTPWRLTWKNVKTKFGPGLDEKGNDILIGEIAVPETAILYNSATKAWEKVGAGITSYSTATYTYLWGKMHNGRPITIADVMYAQAFIYEWMTKDGDDDKYYDASYESTMRPQMEPNKGFVLNKDGTVTTYFNFNWLTPERVAATGPIYVKAGNNSQPVLVSWEIVEALAKLVVEGGQKTKNYSFSSDPAFTEVDVLNPDCVADIRAKLVEMKNARYVPVSIKDYMTAANAVAAYDASIKFIDAHKHAFISNGPFYINTVDLKNNFVELRAFRDPSYPYDSAYWPKAFAVKTTRIDSVNVPSVTSRGKDAWIPVRLSIVDYPAGTAKAADNTAKVKLTLITDDGEKVYNGAFDKTGQYSITIPAADTKALKAGSYTIVIESSMKSEAPAVESATLVVF